MYNFVPILNHEIANYLIEFMKYLFFSIFLPFFFLEWNVTRFPWSVQPPHQATTENWSWKNWCHFQHQLTQINCETSNSILMWTFFLQISRFKHSHVKCSIYHLRMYLKKSGVWFIWIKAKSTLAWLLCLVYDTNFSQQLSSIFSRGF